ncbi:MAG: LamG domain-containing protein [Cyanobacteria bacterium P01_F01_bin.150]
MTVQPNYHWQFDEGQGTTIVDAISGVQATLSNTTRLGRGRIGPAIRINGKSKSSRIVFDNKVSRFGTSDFTIAFGMKILSTYGQKALHVIGNRSTSGHGNFVSIRLKNQKYLTFEVDENKRGKNYALLDSKRALNDKKWHHIAAVRQGRSLKLYIDGELSDESVSKTGIANITTDSVLSIGARGLKTAIAQYEDLRIYDTALDAAEVRALVPPINRPLNSGEIELVATDNASIILTQNVDDLSRLSTSFKQLRVGNNTGVTLYTQRDFGGVAQKCYADLPDLRLSRLKTFPQSMRIWSTVGEPFTGNWMVKTPNGQYLSLGQSVLTTASRQSLNELFRFHYSLRQNQLQLIPGANHENAAFKLSPKEAPAYLFVDKSESLQDEFAIINQTQNEWLALNSDSRANNTFSWTKQKDRRAIFVRSIKIADHEGQVGELAPGEVALYQHLAYHGKTWIFSSSAKDRSGSFTHLTDFQNLNDQTSSIRLGPDTAVTLFKHVDHRAAEDRREEEIEDIVTHEPDLRESQIGNDALSSIKIFRTIAPEDAFTSYTSKLSQDYRMVGDELEEFSSYRTILRFEPGAGTIEVSATDLTEIEVDGTTHEIDETRSVTLSPNEMNHIMITSEADGINTPGLKIRTSDMALNERVVIFPNKDAHRQIAELEDGALWNAKDAKGDLIVDRTAHTKEEVASAQNTIKRVMATVAYADDALEASKANGAANSRVQSSSRVVSSATIDKPWELTLGSVKNNQPNQPGDGSRSLVGKSPIKERPLSSDEWQQLLAQSTSAEDANLPVASILSTSPVTGTIRGTRRGFAAKGLFGRIGRGIKKAIKKATSVVIGKVKDVVHVIVKTAEGIIDFVVDTVEKVAEFVEAVVEKVVKSIKQFIEFLQFLFNWGDILKTQRYLGRAINAGFDYAAQLADDAKPHVSAFVTHLQDSVEDGMNGLVEKLGGEPSDVKTSSFKLPEAIEWLLSKLFGGSKQTDADTEPNSTTAPSEDSPLEAFIRHLLEAIENIAGAGLRGIEGVGESLMTLLQNPLKPQRALIVIIEALRDVVIQLLEAGEQLTLALLEAFEAVIKLFRNLLNSEIKIPFISDLFEFIGAGKLTILNLFTLLLAVPVTIVHKLAFNERPFKNAPPLDFSTSFATNSPTNFSAQSESQITESQLVAAASQIASVEAQAETSENSSKPDKGLVTGLGVTALVANALNGFVLNPYLNVVAESVDAPREIDPFHGVLEALSWVNDLLIWIPTIPGFLKEGSFHDASPEEKTLWIFRTFTLGLDFAVTAYGWVPKKDDQPINTQRMKRATEGTILFFGTMSMIDLLLAANFVSTIEDKQGLNLANQVLFVLPKIGGFLRLVEEPTAPFLLALIDIATAGISTITGSILLVNDLDALDAA